MRRALLAAALLGAAAAPLSGATRFVAFGDSITAGSSWPASCDICPVVFDCTGGCAASSSGRESCGHARRLDAWIDGWAGADDHVVNEGLGGENTPGAVSRLARVLAAECGSPGQCNAVLLKHGTNDMSGSISPETARDNLALMVAEAKSRNIDTVLITAIRKVYEASNSKWQDYRNLVLDLADDESLHAVDAWATLCASTGCFDSKYWVDHASSQCTAPGEGDNDLGHLDPDGYDDLTDLIKDEFPGSTPAAAAPTSPVGDIGEATPDFVWSEVGSARWYQLNVDGAKTWWEAAAHCGGGSCTANPGVALAKGSHSWRVRGRNLRGLGGWSADADFEVWEVPGAPTPSAPSGLYVDDTPMTTPFPWEPYTWSEDPEATDYDLVVSDVGGPVFTRSYDSSICAASVCQAFPDEGLAAGDYSWTVQARNPGASGPASSPLAFEIYDTLPGEATPIAPTGKHFEPFAPLYEWLPAAGAEEYDIEVKDLGGNVDASASGLLASAVCAGGVCSHQGGVLADPDGYTLRVLGRNMVGDGPWSTTGADFEVLACDPSQKDLADFYTSGAVGAGAEVDHCGLLTAGALGGFEIEAGADLSAYTHEGFRADDGFVVKGELGVRVD